MLTETIFQEVALPTAEPCKWCLKSCKRRFIETCPDFQPRVGELALRHPDLVKEVK